MKRLISIVVLAAALIAPAALALPAPVNTVAPVVTGTPTVDKPLTCTTGTWVSNPAPTFTTFWEASPDGKVWSQTMGMGASVTSANSWYFHYVRCEVFANNGYGGNVGAYSAGVALLIPSKVNVPTSPVTTTPTTTLTATTTTATTTTVTTTTTTTTTAAPAATEPQPPTVKNTPYVPTVTSIEELAQWINADWLSRMSKWKH